MPKVLHLTRHAQAEHNVENDYWIPDAPLTSLGRRQAEELNRRTSGLQQKADLLVSSPLKRTLQTTLVGFPELKARLESQEPPKKLIVLSRLQEVNNLPCDTGSDRAVLEGIEEFKGIDFSPLEDDWNSKKGDFHPGRVSARAKWVRRWLRDRPEQDIVVVAHGDILRQITGTPNEHPWANAEIRRFTFASSDDEDAEVVPIADYPTETKVGEVAPTSSELAN